MEYIKIDSALAEFNKIKKDSLLQYTEKVLTLFEVYKHEKKPFVNKMELLFEQLLVEFSIAQNYIYKKNKETSFLFNVLRFFNISETTHSFLIGKLLDPNGEHGQGNLFLKCFLEMFGIKMREKDHWSVTVEIGRIDILIKRKSPHSVILIENKSNMAIDQDCQLYRYWLQEMYIPNDTMPYQYTLEEKSRFRIFYLSPHANKVPCTSSLLKPAWKWLDSKYPSLPDNLDINHIEILNYNKEIIAWLNLSLNCIDLNNIRLREYIKQYIELWSS